MFVNLRIEIQTLNPTIPQQCAVTVEVPFNNICHQVRLGSLGRNTTSDPTMEDCPCGQDSLEPRHGSPRLPQWNTGTNHTEIQDFSRKNVNKIKNP